MKYNQNRKTGYDPEDHGRIGPVGKAILLLIAALGAIGLAVTAVEWLLKHF